MVQFAEYRYSRSPVDYWMLDGPDLYTTKTLRGKLQAKNFTVLRSNTTGRLRTHHVRCQRGLLSYEGLPLCELQLYAAQRGLPPPLGEKATVKILKAQLEQADDNNTFERFSDLPPELRQMIYTHYFKSCNESHSRLCDKYQPPLTLASRNVRREALPLFYECSQFGLNAYAINESAFKPITNDQRLTDVLSPFSAALMKGMSAVNLAYIRSLHINFLDCEMHLKLDTCDQKDPITIGTPYRVNLKTDSRSDPALRERKECTLSDLRTIAKEIAAREGPLKLRESDLERLYETVRIAFVAFYPQD
jgi:hypothetical protein